MLRLLRTREVHRPAPSNQRVVPRMTQVSGMVFQVSPALIWVAETTCRGEKVRNDRKRGYEKACRSQARETSCKPAYRRRQTAAPISPLPIYLLPKLSA